jgi:hypothetical protein
MTAATHTALLAPPATTRRAALPAALALVAVAVVHLLDGPGSLQDTFYIGALELALAAACVPLAIMLIVQPARATWGTAGAITALAFALYVASRTVGLPGSMDDIGNWAQTLGMVNLATEAVVIAMAAWALARRH